MVHCILVSETWLKPSLPLTSYCIPRYRFSVVIVLARGVVALVGTFAADSGSQSSASLKIPSVTAHRQGHRNLLELTLDDNLKSATLTFLFNIATPGQPSSVFKSVSVDAIKKGDRSISTSHGQSGSDNFTLEMLHSLPEDIAPVILHIVNLSLTRNVCPSSWKKAMSFHYIPKRSYLF